MTVSEGSFVLGDTAGVSGPAGIANLVRETLSTTGADTAIDLRLVDDPSLGAEGYRLRVAETGVEATASAVAGLAWSVQSLRQLMHGRELPFVEITDRPRFAWRGCLLDVARWHHPLPFLYRFVDLIALHKLNTLHLHLTDDQGWRFEVRRYPKLTEVGGFRSGSQVGHAKCRLTNDVPHGGFYTQNELRDLVKYAERLGVRIMPEVDAPGHTQAAIAAYPWLGNRPERLDVRVEWGISPHVANVSDEAADFFRHVLSEVSDVFPFEYVHIGGDEVPADEWAASTQAAARVASEGLPGPDHLLGWWSRQLTDHLAGLGRKSAVWDEVLEAGLPQSAAVFAWRGVDRVSRALEAGIDVVAAPYEHTYLDWAESDDPNEPLAIGGVLPLRKVYDYDPPDAVLGVQAQVWSEYLPTPELVEWRAFPRLCAISEIGWSKGERDFDDFRQRLSNLLGLLDQLGVGYRPPAPASAQEA